MERLSRVKKYEQLRNSIENEGVSTSGANAAIKDITTIQDDVRNYTPSHEKESNFNDEVKKDELDSTFKNEYLDSFIQEVRDYNIKKGVREYEDTKLDILQQLSSKNREKRANYIEHIDDETINDTETKEVSDETMQISKQVFDLLNDQTNLSDDVNDDNIEETSIGFASTEPTISESIVDEKTISADANRVSTELEERIASLETQLVETTQQLKKQNIEEDDFEAYSKRELIEETMKLKVQMNEYKDELEDLNTGIDSNNRLLNIIITILIIALLGVIGVVVYWLISGGII